MAKPIIKWVGGKRQLLVDILTNLPVNINTLSKSSRYFEPFIGGGALFFALQDHWSKNTDSVLLQSSVINDFNPELTNLYQCVKDYPNELFHCLNNKDIFKNEKSCFLKIREWDREINYLSRPSFERAARFLYLNRTAFNGIWRVNSKGFFNVPFGNYKNPGMPTLQQLKDASIALSNTTIFTGDFEKSLDSVSEGDFVYFDPPYVPLSNTSSFVGYTKNGFDFDMQKRLSKLCRKLTENNVNWMLSNSDTLLSRELFGNIPGVKIKTVSASRSINSNGNGRGKVSELLAVYKSPVCKANNKLK